LVKVSQCKVSSRQTCQLTSTDLHEPLYPLYSLCSFRQRRGRSPRDGQHWSRKRYSDWHIP
jgi:hypothetical protein